MNIKKILIGLLTLFIIGACTNSTKKTHNTLKEKDFSLEIYYHHFGTTENKDNLILYAYYVNVNNADIDINNVDVNIEGIDLLGDINKELTENDDYTKNYCKNRIFPDDDNYIAQYYVLTTKVEPTLHNSKHIRASITYKGETIKIEISGFMELG